MFYAIDLFCGAGGFSEGLIQAGFHIVYSSDINEMVEKTYTNRHTQLGLIQGYNTFFERSDIRNLKGKDIIEKVHSLEIFKEKKVEIDAIFGGPPCQGFSRAGKRNPNDPRNMLFKEYIRLINEIKPKYIVIENVTGFLDMGFYNYESIDGTLYEDGTNAPTILKNELELIGYDTLTPKILNAANYGVPQRRKRVIFIAYRRDCLQPEYPIETHDKDNFVTIGDAISDLCETKKESKTFYQKESINGRTKSITNNKQIQSISIKNNETPIHSEIIEDRFSLYLQNETTQMLRKRIKEKGINLIHCNALLDYCSSILNEDKTKLIELFLCPNVNDNYIDVLLTKKGMRTRFSMNDVSSTVMTIADDYIHPIKNRTFSVRELARLQSFDDSFEFLGKRTTGGKLRKVEVPQYTQVGNAVPPLLAKAIAQEIIKTLEEMNNL